MYFVDKKLLVPGGELEQVPDDEEVKIADERSATRKRIIREATEWGSAPSIVKFLLISGALASNIYCLIFGFQSSRCFRDYSITDTVAMP